MLGERLEQRQHRLRGGGAAGRGGGRRWWRWCCAGLLLLFLGQHLVDVAFHHGHELGVLHRFGQAERRAGRTRGRGGVRRARGRVRHRGGGVRHRGFCGGGGVGSSRTVQCLPFQHQLVQVALQQLDEHMVLHGLLEVEGASGVCGSVNVGLSCLGHELVDVSFHQLGEDRVHHGCLQVKLLCGRRGGRGRGDERSSSVVGGVLARQDEVYHRCGLRCSKQGSAADVLLR